jgi:activating signal cointegrator 1
MKALTLTQPWASLVAIGAKRIETRSWYTAYRGPLAIHAAKGFPAWAKEFAEVERALGRVPGRIPLACIVATARLVRVRKTQDIEPTISAVERHYGDYSWGRFAWILEDVVALPEPIYAKGALGLWNWEPAANTDVVDAAPTPKHLKDEP